MKKTKRIICSLIALVMLVSCMCLTACAKKKPNTPDTPDTPEQPKPTGILRIEGVEDTSITQGKFFDANAGITATSAWEEDITGRIVMTGSVNTSKVGDYTLTYSITDNGETVTEKRKVTVVANPHIDEVIPTPIFKAEESYNIANGCTATATKTTNGSETRAVDGNSDTRWECLIPEGLTQQDEYLVDYTVDLGDVLAIEGVAIDWEAACAAEFELQISSDGKTYETIESVTGFSVPVQHGTWSKEFDNEYNARYVRVHCIRRATNYAYSIFEFEVFGKQGTVLPTDKYPVLFEAKGSVEDEQWILFDFGEVKEFNKMNVEQFDWRSPAEYDMLYADENTEAAWDEAKALRHKFTVQYGTGNLLVRNQEDREEATTISARYVKFDIRKRNFADYSYIYRTIELKNGDTVLPATVTASSAQEGFEAQYLAATGDGRATPWKSDYAPYVEVLDYKDFPDGGRTGTLYAARFDLGKVEAVGRVDLTWRGDDGGKGKYYDLQTSTDGVNWKTVFRQTHGDRQLQSVYVYESARYIRIIDYQNTSETMFMLEGIVVNSQYPEGSGEGKVNYNVNLTFPQQQVIQTENGSYVTGGTNFPTSRLIAYLDDSLRDKPVPSNDWWQGLLVTDKGYNLFMNPLMMQFRSDGFWITQPGDGYFAGDYIGNSRQTVDVDNHDVRVGYAGMSRNAEVRVTDYTDYSVSAVMTDNKNVDKLTVFLSQGALYSYFLYAEPEKATVWANNLIAVYDIDGEEILKEQDTDYTGDAIILCTRAHFGNEYEERYYIVNAPEGTQFVREEAGIAAVMKNGNYMSVGALSSKTTVTADDAKESFAHGTLNTAEAKLMHDHGYAFIIGSYTSYDFESTTNKVTTDFRVRTMLMRQGYSNEAYTAYLPHQTEKASGYKFEKYTYDSIRGDCKAFIGNELKTVDYFYGVVPTFTEPNDDGYSADVLYQQLVLLYANNGGDKKPEDSNLISGDPYWQGKNLHPMAMAALAADQIGATDLRDAFLEKIEYILTDWFTYDPVKDASTGAYFYYDSEWGTLYYKNSEFGAGVNLADHYFTYGYYTLASGVLCAYRPEFAKKYGDMIELLIRDYMNWKRDDDMFPYMRNFDMFAGHGWAGGYADNNGGNNQESAGEALNSWVGAYLYATAVGNENIRDAAIYGFTTELNAIKHYWFNYTGDFGEYPYGVAGQVYGGSNFFGTFFQGEPLFMYGIHLIPGEEYLTSYALNDKEREKLEGMIDKMRQEQGMWNVEEAHKEIYAWQHIFIPIVAIYDPDEAIQWYEDTLKKQGNVGNTSEQFNVYWLIHGMKSTGKRTTDIWAENGATATVYALNGGYNAVCWNPTDKPVRYTFRNKNGVVGSALVPACSLVTVDPTKITEKFAMYTDNAAVKPSDYSEIKNAKAESSAIVFSKNGSVKYLLSCGTQEEYTKIKLSGTLTNAKLFIDGNEYVLTKTSDGYETAPVVVTFKHTVEIKADGGNLTAIAFAKQELNKIDIAGATATTNSENGNEHVIGHIVDGNVGTRWESKHGVDDVWLEITLKEAVTVYQLQIIWEGASAAEYKVYFAGDDKEYREVYHGEYSQGARTDKVAPTDIMTVKYIKIEGISRTTTYGYSIYEVELYGLS